MTISLNDLSKLAGEDMRRKDAKKRGANSDPFRKPVPKQELRRARPRPKSRPSVSLGGEHS